MKSEILDRTFRFHDFRIVTRIFFLIEFSKTEFIVFNLITNFFRSIKQRHNIKVDSKKSFVNWSEKWKQSLSFVRTIKNFVNVIKFYRETKYFYTFNIILVKELLSLNNESSSDNSFINDTSSKPKFDSSIKVLRLFRYFVNGLNDFSVNFSQQRIEFIKTFNFFSFTNSLTSTTNSRRQISVTSTKKVIHKELIELLSLVIDITDFLFEQQRTIVVII